MIESYFGGDDSLWYCAHFMGQLVKDSLGQLSISQQTHVVGFDVVLLYFFTIFFSLSLFC